MGASKERLVSCNSVNFYIFFFLKKKEKEKKQPFFLFVYVCHVYGLTCSILFVCLFVYYLEYFCSVNFGPSLPFADCMVYLLFLIFLLNTFVHELKIFFIPNSVDFFRFSRLVLIDILS